MIDIFGEDIGEFLKELSFKNDSHRYLIDIQREIESYQIRHQQSLQSYLMRDETLTRSVDINHPYQNSVQKYTTTTSTNPSHHINSNQNPRITSATHQPSLILAELLGVAQLSNYTSSKISIDSENASSNHHGQATSFYTYYFKYLLVTLSFVMKSDPVMMEQLLGLSEVYQCFQVQYLQVLNIQTVLEVDLTSAISRRTPQQYRSESDNESDQQLRFTKRKDKNFHWENTTASNNSNSYNNPTKNKAWQLYIKSSASKLKMKEAYRAFAKDIFRSRFIDRKFSKDEIDRLDNLHTRMENVELGDKVKQCIHQ